MQGPPDISVMIGTAGWSLPLAEQAHFPGEGSHLQRYAAHFPVAEINSTFHRSHRAATLQRWHDSVPSGFRFSAKIPKAITHGLRLKDAEEPLATFFGELEPLRDKLACLLVQLPPSLEFHATTAAAFFKALNAITDREVLVCEPRHASWFEGEADALLQEYKVARAGADPARVPIAAEPGGWRGLSYYRLHGSPKVYYSAYTEEFIGSLTVRLRVHAAEGRKVWCIFDNTTLGAATANALRLLDLLRP